MTIILSLAICENQLRKTVTTDPYLNNLKAKLVPVKPTPPVIKTCSIFIFLV